jgi:hypothetical protein
MSCIVGSQVLLVATFKSCTVFIWFFRSTFPICSTILCTPIPIIFFLRFLTWGSHNHFIRVRYTIRGPTKRNIICFNSHSHFSPYNNNPPYFCFPFIGEWCVYNKSNIKCDSFFFTIVGRDLNIKSFSVIVKMCSLVSIGPLYITSSQLFYSWFRSSYFGCIDGI